MLKNNFKNFLIISLIFLMMSGWIFSGWPRVWNNPQFPPKIREARAAVSYITDSSISGKTVTCTVGKPTGLAVNDLMIAHLVWEAEGTGISGPSGWETVGSEDRVSAGVMRSKLMYKIAVQADVDATSFAFTNSTSAQHVCVISVFQGYDLTAPINASNGQVNAASLTVTSAGITPSAANTMILMFASISDDNTQSTYAITTNNPASWLEAYDVKDHTGSDVAAAMGYATRPETTATGNGTAVSSASNINIGHLVAIKPAVAPTVTTQPADPVGDTTATCNGTITATGGANATAVGCEWDTDSGAPYANNPSTAGDYGAAPFTQSLTSLPSGTTIYARAFAANIAGTGYGSEVNFLTKIISVTLDHENFDYGKVANNTASSTLNLWGGAGIIATNGDAIADFYVYGANSTGSGGGWTLADNTTGNNYIHKFCNDTDYDCASPPTNYTALTTSPVLVKSTVTPSGTMVFQLEIITPTTPTDLSPQNAVVTIQASAP